ncbi:histidine phosphatase family protein [Streptococcus cuniculi]|uniref:Histidine phosphatase family protein n=1 Tax=Streptococcus cuniculi TaxID=1432788 RepID=A0A4Y9JF71_9STRE|nr:histidine phosphatase family protein [Streptococcus cuniculi]MBF0777841.1 histidine phosphatase family protein [Streptococcus cuniculi]TFU98485.1 histidine phosphatase family protein [Streptococcus cuniculi]
MRHGETLFNTQKRVQGWSDSPLTENGIAQARSVADYFADKGIHFEAVYSSTQERATDTAKLVARIDKVTQLKGIKEMNFGSFEAQPEILLPKHRPNAKSFEDLLVPYGGEDILEVGKRVRQTLIDTMSHHDNLCLFVSHGAAMWGLIQLLKIEFPPNLRFSNCAILKWILTDEILTLTEVILPTEGFKVYPFKERSKE